MLTLHLKRFQQDLSGRLRKIDGPVPFPKALDMSPYCDPEVTFCCTQTEHGRSRDSLRCVHVL